MRNTPIIVGDASSVLQSGPTDMQRIGDWQKSDSDLFAHFLQVNKQISESRWRYSDVSFTSYGERITQSSFPGIEEFVYVAVYFRQLYHRRKNDQLLNRVCDRHMHFCKDIARTAWISEERSRFNATLHKPFLMLPNYSVEQIIESFMYGASILHGIPPGKCKNRAVFRDLAENHPRERVLFALHSSLRMLHRHVSALSSVVYQDFSSWLSKGLIPRPDVIWHFKFFDTSTTNHKS